MRISEIFRSIQGEGRRAGQPCTFIRIAGCPQRCNWCDTAYALKAHSGEVMHIEQIVEAAGLHGLDFVLITGGEPLAHKDTPLLAQALLDAGARELAVETSGAFDVGPLPPEVHLVMDWKCPDSGEHQRNLDKNLWSLRKSDDLKFVIATRPDFDWAIEQVDKHQLCDRSVVYFSAVAAIPRDAPGGPDQPTLPPATLADWILESKQPIRLQLQLHKLLWPNKDRGY